MTHHPTDEVRCAFHLGDKDSVPQSPPRKGGKESLPRPLYRRFFRPAPLSEEEEVALRHKELAEEQLRRPAHEAEQERQQRQAEGPPAKRVKGEPSPPPPPPPAPAPAPAPVAPPLPPPPAPALVLPSLEAAPVDVSQLAALRRRVSELTQPEVLTVGGGWEGGGGGMG